MSSNLLTVVGEKPRSTEERTITVPVAKQHKRITVTCTTGTQFQLDQATRSYVQTAVTRSMADIISQASFISGEYWMLHPDPPIEGEDLKITAPRANGHRRVIELYRIHIEPTDTPDPASSD